MRAVQRNFVLIQVGQGIHALPLSFVQEVTFLAELSTVPTMPPLLAGMLNLRGQAVAVIRLARLLGMGNSTEGLYSSLVITRAERSVLALLVDAVPDHVSVDADRVVCLPDGNSFQDLATESFEWKGETVIVLSPERLLTEKEKQFVESFRAAEVERMRMLEEVPA